MVLTALICGFYVLGLLTGLVGRDIAAAWWVKRNTTYISVEDIERVRDWDWPEPD